MKYIFILCVFKILDVDVFMYIFAQTFKGLTLTKNFWKEGVRTNIVLHAILTMHFDDMSCL
jgi:hypothetical protein